MLRIILAVVSLVLLASCATTQQVTPAVLSDLAPTGKMRVGINFQNQVLTRKDPATGEPGGIAVDLARELSRRLGMPLEIVPYTTAGNLAAGATSGAWDVAFLAIEMERAKEIDFAPAGYLEIETTYLVPAGSAFRTVDDVDRQGVRIAVGAKGGPDLALSRLLKNAQLVRAPTSAAATKMFVSDKLDALAGLRPTLTVEAEKIPGSRLLDGRFTVVQQSAGTPRGHEAGAAYVREFIEDIKKSGLVARLIEKNGAKGAKVAPPAK
ncbi:MAG TPA: transporter substrate-binding domain-containing protein [Burkholderiales bacterium]|nr:transporter substrate-binding domain-containing protein [Burkholderiales bacterium]